MKTTSLFRSNRSQAVRLARDVAFPEIVSEVVVVREGAGRLIVPADSVWDSFFDTPGIDIADRDQPPAQQRDKL